MDAVLFLKEWKRMCESVYNICKNCAWGNARTFENTCREDMFDEPEKAVEIVEKWSRENPIKTMMDDFFEKFPNAPKEDSGAPCGCPWEMGYCKQDSGICDYCSCDECWSRPLEVKE